MRTKRKIHLLTIFLTWLLISSCQKINSYPTRDIASINSEQSDIEGHHQFNLNAIVGRDIENDTLNGEERNIALRICYAYESKSHHLVYEDLSDRSFEFLIEKQNCQGEVEQKTERFTIKKGSDAYYLQAKQMPANPQLIEQAFTLIQTNERGVLAKVCDKIKTNQKISNKIITSDGEIHLAFFKHNLDAYKITQFSKNNRGILVNTLQNEYYVRTEINYKKEKIMGMDEEIVQEKSCGQSNQEERVKAVTRFKLLSIDEI